MNDGGGKKHYKHEDLIDFVDGDLAPGRAAEIEEHLTSCEVCRSYVESLRRTLALVAEGTVPEPHPGYWAHFEGAVRQRARLRRMRSVLVFAPGVAGLAVAVALVLIWARASQYRPDATEIMLSDMSPGEMVESVAASADIDLFLAGAPAYQFGAVEEYLIQTDDIYDLIDDLSEEERRRLSAEISNLMKPDDTSMLRDHPARKGC